MFLLLTTSVKDFILLLQSPIHYSVFRLLDYEDCYINDFGKKFFSILINLYTQGYHKRFSRNDRIFLASFCRSLYFSYSAKITNIIQICLWKCQIISSLNFFFFFWTLVSYYFNQMYHYILGAPELQTSKVLFF